MKPLFSSTTPLGKARFFAYPTFADEPSPMRVEWRKAHHKRQIYRVELHQAPPSPAIYARVEPQKGTGWWVGPLAWDLRTRCVKPQGYRQIIDAIARPKKPRRRGITYDRYDMPPAWEQAQLAVQSWLYALLPPGTLAGFWQGPSSESPAHIYMTDAVKALLPPALPLAILTALNTLPPAQPLYLLERRHRKPQSFRTERRPMRPRCIDPFSPHMQSLQPLTLHQRLHLQQMIETHALSSLILHPLQTLL